MGRHTEIKCSKNILGRLVNILKVASPILVGWHKEIKCSENLLGMLKGGVDTRKLSVVKTSCISYPSGVDTKKSNVLKSSWGCWLLF